MTVRFGRGAALTAVLSVGLVMSAGCTRVKDHQGYLADATLIASVQPGVDNRESVTTTLGRPTFVGQFDQRDWYYVSRNLEYLGFQKPSASEQMVLHIRFDEAGNVASVERSGLEKVAAITPSADKTPTLGRDRSFFEELFGNIGQVGATGQSTGTADNPQ